MGVFGWISDNVYNKDLGDVINRAGKGIGDFQLDISANLTKIESSLRKFGEKPVNMSIVDDFTRKIYKNENSLAKLITLQYMTFLVILYFYNPLKITTKFPAFTKLLVLIIAFVYVILFIFIKESVSKGLDVDLNKPNETKMLLYFLSIIIFFVLFMYCIKGVIWLFMHTSLIVLARHFLLALVISGFIGIIYVFLKKQFVAIDKYPKSIFSILVKLILYIPCALVDLVNYFKQEFSITTKPVWILLAVECVFISAWLLIPVLFNVATAYDSIVLVNVPIDISTQTTVSTYEQLHGDKDIINTDGNKDLYKKSNPESLSYNDSVKEKLNDRGFSEYQSPITDPNVPKNKILAWIYNKIKTMKIPMPSIEVMPSYSDIKKTDKSYQYSISFWYYLNSFPPNTRAAYGKYSNILKYGNKLGVEYNASLGKVRVIGSIGNLNSLGDTKSNSIVTVYESDSVLLQKWNNMVINYSDGIMDVFLNGELVETKNNMLPYMYVDDVTVGEFKGVSGGICNVKYYRIVQSLSDIKVLYKTLSAKKVPLLNSLWAPDFTKKHDTINKKNIITDIKSVIGGN